MKTALAVLIAAVCLSACKKEPKPEPEPAPPAQRESVPISNDPRKGASMIDAAKRVAGQASDAGAEREAEAAKGN